MKLLFASLLCHRDVQIFQFNWFCMRAHLDHGFDIPHLILSDGSLSEQDISELELLPNVFVEKEPIIIYDAPKAVLLGKLECLKRGFEKYSAERVVVFDCDIFFYKNWDADLRKIISERVVVMRDWGSSLGPEAQKYFDYFGIREDLTTPNCNTGIISIRTEDYHLIDEKLKMHLKNPFKVQEDQGIIFAAFYGNIKYVNNIVCVITGAENYPKLWQWVLSQNGAHLMGMRTRIKGLKSLVEYSLEKLPAYLPLKQFTPIQKHVGWGLMEYDTYNFSHPLQKLPTTFKGEYVTNAMYLHGGSEVVWEIPTRCHRFSTTPVCMDTGIPENTKYVTINSIKYSLNKPIDVPISGRLEISTHQGPGTHFAFLEPRILLDNSLESVNLDEQIMSQMQFGVNME